MGPDRPRQPIVRDQNRRLTAAAGGIDPATERNPARTAGVRNPWLLRPIGSPSRLERPVCLEGSDGFVSSRVALVATGWSDPDVGQNLHFLKINTCCTAYPSFRLPSAPEEEAEPKQGQRDVQLTGLHRHADHTLDILVEPAAETHDLGLSFLRGRPQTGNNVKLDEELKEQR